MTTDGTQQPAHDMSYFERSANEYFDSLHRAEQKRLDLKDKIDDKPRFPEQDEAVNRKAKTFGTGNPWC
jgi:hypothetical protein